MFISYDAITMAFLEKVQEYEFMHLQEDDRQAIVDRYMKSAAAKFSEVCQYDIANGDDLARQYTLEGATEMEADEIIDILTDGMVAQWMRQYVYRQDNLELMLNTSDFSTYSPAELTKQIRAVYEDCRKHFANRVNEYSYRHGDLTDLHL